MLEIFVTFSAGLTSLTFFTSVTIVTFSTSATVDTIEMLSVSVSIDTVAPALELFDQHVFIHLVLRFEKISTLSADGFSMGYFDPHVIFHHIFMFEVFVTFSASLTSLIFSTSVIIVTLSTSATVDTIETFSDSVTIDTVEPASEFFYQLVFILLLFRLEKMLTLSAIFKLNWVFPVSLTVDDV